MISKEYMNGYSIGESNSISRDSVREELKIVYSWTILNPPSFNVHLTRLISRRLFMLITKLTASFRFIQIRMTLTGHACVTPISYCQHDIHYYLELTNKLIIFTVFDPQTSFVIVRTTVERLILACPTIHKDPSGNTPGKSGYPALSVRAVFMGPYFMLWGTAALQWSAMGQALTFLCEH